MVWHKITLDYTIKEVMEVFEHNYDRVVMVVNSEEKVVGSISQGDIIKALVGGATLFARAENIMNTAFIYLNTRDMELAYEIVKNKRITLIPVLDNDGRLLSVISLEDIFEYLEDKR